MKKWGQKSRLAAELGISPAAITKLAKQGMPVDDADAARRWRLGNLAPGRMRPDPGPSADTLLQRAQSLAELAAVALERHQLDLVANDLRMAMHLVPKSHRSRLVMSFDLMRALIGEYALAVLAGGGTNDEQAEPDGAPPPAEDGLDLGEVAYCLACWEARIT